jgi:hypothetical protein
MKSFFEDVLKLPYKPNSQVNPEHENQVEELIKKHSLEYKSQPNGTQNSPDFRVTYHGQDYDIECKSSKGHFPVYNGGLPKPGVIYIFSSAKYDSTTIFFAEDVVSEEKRELYSCLEAELNEVLLGYQNLELWKNDDRGFDFYIRNMYTQKGGAPKVNYFTHANRRLCEQRILNHTW